MLTGVISTLLIWPKTTPTGSAWFWICLLVFPGLAWCVAFGLRLHYYDDETARLQAEAETREQDRAETIRFASEPLAVLSSVYLCALGPGAAYGMTQQAMTLNTQKPLSGGHSIRHTALAFLGADVRERYSDCFIKLLSQMHASLETIPQHVPLDVQLQISADKHQSTLLALWQICWQTFGYRPAPATLLSPTTGLMSVDTWLDIQGGPALEKFTLIVSVQLHDTPPQNSTEAAVALLLNWAPLAERHGLQPLARLHRPVEATTNALDDALATTLLWGDVTAPEVNHLWQAGLEPHDKSALVQGASNLAFGVSQTEALSGIHDIDAALGHPGVASGWLACALALEHAAQSSTPQLIACREGTLRLAIAQPATPASHKDLKT
ncbi:hypothetical protein [Paraburkholderia bonniea]|uniref:hypothetical protein n=1 Tax=Paraburkholderia bonniea TaxID=2152891 RepID=UPI001FEA690B|nr:hypothetical protein [Paraburkholderia bonniea]